MPKGKEVCMMAKKEEKPKEGRQEQKEITSWIIRRR